MTTPPPAEDVTIQTQIGLADTPMGQRAAIMITVLLGKDAALQVADHIKTTAGQLSSTRLVIAKPGDNGLTPGAGHAVGQ
jgi:hypothetical protein